MMKCHKCGYPIEPSNVVIGGRRKFKRLAVGTRKLTTAEIEMLTTQPMRWEPTGTAVLTDSLEPPPSIWALPVTITIMAIIWMAHAWAYA